MESETEVSRKTDDDKKLLRDQLTLQYTRNSVVNNNIKYRYKTKFGFEREGSFQGPIKKILANNTL